MEATMNCSFSATYWSFQSAGFHWQRTNATYDELDHSIIKRFVRLPACLLHEVEEVLDEQVVEHTCAASGSSARARARRVSRLTEVLQRQLLHPAHLVQQPDGQQSEPRLNRDSNPASRPRGHACACPARVYLVDVGVEVEADVIHQQRYQRLPLLLRAQESMVPAAVCEQDVV